MKVGTQFRSALASLGIFAAGAILPAHAEDLTSPPQHAVHLMNDPEYQGTMRCPVIPIHLE
jgi:hypothetical protein